MSCPSCGAQLEVLNQRFCQNCGGKVHNFSKDSNLSQESSPSSGDHKIHQITQKIEKPSGPRPLSKRSLGFGVVSVVIAVTSFNFGPNLLIPPFILTLSARMNIILYLGIFNIIGIVFGIISRVFNSQAKGVEPKNTAMKAGSALGSIGLIINLLLMIAAFLFVGILNVL